MAQPLHPPFAEVMSSTTSASIVFDNFVKSPHDKCNYRMITLPNLLQACLVSEPGLEKVIVQVFLGRYLKFRIIG